MKVMRYTTGRTMHPFRSDVRSYRTAISEGRLHVSAVPLELRESIGSLASGEIPPVPPPYHCNLCGRSNLRSWEAARQHVAVRHTAELMKTVDDDDVETAVRLAPAIGDVDSLFESALIHIVNCTDIDEAVRIATDALLGR